MQKKVMLMRPYYFVNKAYYPLYVMEPIGLEYVAAAIRDIAEVQIFDCIGQYPSQSFPVASNKQLIHLGASKSQIIKKLKKFKPDIVGISSPFIVIEPCVKEVAELIKKVNPSTKVVVGGAHPSSRMEILDCKDIDIIVIGEGEETFKELIKTNFTNLGKIKGIAFKKDGKVFKTEKREPLDINKIPHRAFDLNPVDYQKNSIIHLYLSLFKKMGIKPLFQYVPFTKKIIEIWYNQRSQKKRLPISCMVTSRGCPNRCTFCAIKNVWGRVYRMRSVENLLEEVEYLVKHKKVKHINIVDDNFTVSKRRVIDFCKEIIRRKYDLTFNCSSGVYVPTLDEEVLSWMKKAGFNSLAFGIESGNQEVLDKIIKKNLKLSQVKDVISICKKLKIYTTGFFILGLPGETFKTMQDTVDYALSSGLDRIRCYSYQPLPGSELFDLVKEKNWLSPDFDPVYTLLTSCERLISTPELPPEKVSEFIAQARKQFLKAKKYQDSKEFVSKEG